MFWNCLGVALCGALGSLVRYGVGVGSQALVGERNVYGTFVVNVVGCFLIGMLAAATFDETHANAQRLRVILGVGFLGGFTTFSAFGLETFALLEKHQPLLALGNASSNVLLGLLAVGAGLSLGRYLWPA